MSNKKALLVIDAQVNMFAENFSVYQAEQILQTIGILIERAREMDTAVIFVRNNGTEGDPDEPNTPGWQIHPDLKTAPSDIILDKTTSDTFASTNLKQILDEYEIDTLFMTGMQTEMCVQATTGQALELGYQVTLVADGHTTFDFPDEPPATEIINKFNEEFVSKAQVRIAESIQFD